MLSYQNDKNLKRKFVAQILAHRKADRIIQGTYGSLFNNKWKGCAVACSVRSLDRISGLKTPEDAVSYRHHEKMSRRLGVPLTLVYLEDRIFESLPKAKALDWPARFAKAIPVGGDLSLVWPKFALWLLADKKHGALQAAKSDRMKGAIGVVVTLYEREIAGDRPMREEWRSAFVAPSYAAAADAAADAAAAASYAAAYAAAYTAAAYAAAYAAAAAAYTAAAYAAYAAAAAAAAAAARRKFWNAAANKLVSLLEAA